MAEQWFDEYLNMVREIPDEAVHDCTHPGPCDDDVAYWVRRLDFDAPQDETRAYLKEYGAWDAEELADHGANVLRLFWLLCCDLKENPGEPIILMH